MNNILFIILILIGSLQIVGLSLGVKSIRGIGIASVASPLPLVFSHFRGYETFAADFSIELYKEESLVRSIPIDPSLYSRLKGPYNRRNVFGAAFAYGPYLDQPEEVDLVASVLKFGFCKKENLPTEFGIEEEFDRVVVVVVPSNAKDKVPKKVGVTCP